MNVVSDASPLIILAKIGAFDLLPRLHERIYISAEVYSEVVVAGAGLAGASQVAKAEWIEVKSLRHADSLAAAQERFGLGLGELSAILLAKEIGVPMVLMDEESGRQVAREGGLQVRGSIGILGKPLSAQRNSRSTRKFQSPIGQAGSPRFGTPEPPVGAIRTPAALSLGRLTGLFVLRLNLRR